MRYGEEAGWSAWSPGEAVLICSRGNSILLSILLPGVALLPLPKLDSQGKQNLEDASSKTTVSLSKSPSAFLPWPSGKKISVIFFSLPQILNL